MSTRSLQVKQLLVCSEIVFYIYLKVLHLRIVGSGNEAWNVITSEDISSFASKIGANWKKLASHLDLKPKDIKEIEEDSDDIVLQVWEHSKLV